MGRGKADFYMDGKLDLVFVGGLARIPFGTALQSGMSLN
jgi:hypothetical protein